jgi:hypothetical protein
VADAVEKVCGIRLDRNNRIIEEDFFESNLRFGDSF